MKTFRLLATLLSVSLLSIPGFAQDNSELASLLSKARRGNGIAQYNLGLAYAEGTAGIAVDRIEAYVWLSLARENGARGRALDALIGNLDKDSLDQAARRLEALKEELGIATPSVMNVRTESPVPAVQEVAAVPPAKSADPTAEETMARLAAERTTLANRLDQLTAEVTALRADRERLISLSADHEKAARAATENLQAARHELEEARTFGRQVEDTLNKVNDDRTRVAAAARAELEEARAFGQQVEATLNRISDQKTALETALRTAEQSRDGYAQQVESAKAQIAELETRSRTATAATTADSAALAELKLAYAKLAAQIEAAKHDIASVTQSRDEAVAALTAKPAAPGFPDLRDRVATLERDLTAARSAAPAYPDLTGRVTELEKAYTAASTSLAQAQAALAAKPAEPAYPDLRSQVTALEAKAAELAADNSRTQQEFAAAVQSNEANLRTLHRELDATKGALAKANDSLAAKPVGPAYPDLTGKVTELETQLASLTQKSTAAEQARAEAAKQFDDYKTSTAAAQRERTTLLASVKLLESDKASLRRQADTAGAEAEQMRTQVTALKSQLAAKPVAPAYPDLAGKVAELEAQLVAARQPVTPAYPDLSGRVSELESQLSAAKSAAPAYPDLSGRVAGLESAYTAASTNLAQAQAALAAKPAAPTYPDLRDQVSNLEHALVAARTAAPAYPDLRSRVATLESSLAVAEASLAAKPAAPAYPDLRERVTLLESDLTAAKRSLAARPAAPAYPDLTDKVAELETNVRDTTRQLAAASTEADRVKRELADLAKAKADAKPAASAYPDYSARVMELTNEANQLRTDREALQKSAAAAERQISELATSTQRVTELESQVENLKTALAAPAAPSYPDLSGKVAELENQVGNLKIALAAPAAYPDLRERVTELETSLAAVQSSANTTAEADAQLRRERDELASRATNLAGEVTQLRDDRERMQKMLADAGRNLRDATAEANQVKELETQAAGLQAALASAQSQVSELQSALAAKPAAPSYPDLSGQVADLENQVGNLKIALAAPAAYPDLRGRVADLESQLAKKPSGPVYPNLAGRVAELETQLAASERSRRPPAYPDLSGRVSDLQSALADSRRELSETQSRLASQPVATESTTDTSALEQKLAETEGRLTTALRGYALLEKSRDESASKSDEANTALSRQVETLTAQVAALQSADTARIADMENRAIVAQTEIAQLRESLAALQRTSSQSTTEATAAAALVRQLQGANSVLANENYQLKTRLSRTTGGATPTAPTALPAPLPTVRLHTVASGDSLSKISQLYYGTPNRWQEIYSANAEKLGPTGVLRIGTELLIP